ncbi:MAG TPA: hypothetical protein VJ654_13085 [Noviherbaspirillum sp.]|nr:hypothetical protein [Noviherbaspirillum sp.]
MKKKKSILLCGASGLVGGECLRLLLADPAVDRVVTLGRKPLALETTVTGNAAKLEQHVIDFDRLDSYADLLRVDQIICALGTTIKQAGSEERFRQVDFDYPLALARLGAEQGAKHFLLVSAMGANACSRIFYNRVKGELEEAIFALPYQSVTIARPSLLLGERDEFRLGEELGKRFAFLFPSRYKPITAGAVAAALVEAAREDRPERRIMESAQMNSRAGATGTQQKAS